MRKTKQIIFLFCMSLVFITACSDDDEDSTEGQVKTIINTLNGISGLEQFANAFSWLNFSNIDASQFTVFAVKNNSKQTLSEASSDENLTSEVVKRHIVKGCYHESDLTDGMVLISLANDTIVVTKVGDNVLINGTYLDGKEIKADKSVIYVVTEQLPVYHSITTVFAVNECNKNWSPENNAAGFPVADAIVKIYQLKDQESDEFILYKTYTTDAKGIATFKHQQNLDYYYAVEKGNASNLHNGYNLIGIYVSQEDISNSPKTLSPVKPGDLKYADMNCDGIINDYDKIEVPYLLIDSSEDYKITCYIY